MTGGFAVKAVIIAFALLAVWLLIINILGLCAALRLFADSKNGRLLKIKAVVKWSSPASIGSSRAVAEYSVGERKIPNGRMIGASAERLTEGQTVNALVSQRSPVFFAVDERQIKSALSAYVVMCLMFLVIAAFLFYFAVNYITSS